MADDGNPFSVPADTPIELVDNDPLDQPVEEEFRAGLMRLGWDPATAQVVVEAFPFDELQDQGVHGMRWPRARRGRDVFDAVDRRDVRMIERGERARLPFEAAKAVGIAAELVPQHLERDLAPKPRVARPVDLAHAAGAERLEHLIHT